MSETLKLPTCGKCGAALSGYAPDGLCAACLLDSAFEERDVQFGDPAKPAPLFAFKDYELLEEIARGGMGVVYRARQISLNRLVAIKMILGGHLANAAEMHRFRVEAETAAQLQHPNIVAIHEVGEHAGQPFFSMDFVAGRSLAQCVHDGPLPARKAATYLKTIAEAVQYAHSCSVLHRDLKPSNILIDDADQPRVTDFGLAKRLDDPQLSPTDSQLTQTGQVLGSPSFIPPEQAAGQRDKIGPSSDVYSLGAMLYHCLTARTPFMAETLTQTLRMVAENDAVSPRLLNASVPRDLETICLKCLEKDPQRRYATAQELADELGRHLRDEPIHARPIGSAARLGRWCRRKPALAAAVALLLVVAIGSPIAALRINHERLRAQTEATKSRQVTGFLTDMLEGVGPSKARGRDTAMLSEVLDGMAKRVGQDLKEQPEVEADLRMILGKTYADLGLTTNAIQMAKEALRLRRSHAGPVSIGVADALANLGVFFYNASDFSAAERYDREALAMRIKLLGNAHTNVAMSLNNLGVALWQQVKLAEAKEVQQRALAMRTKLLPANHPHIGMSLLNLGNVAGALGELSSAETNYAAALEILRQSPTDKTPIIAVVQNNLATLLGKRGDLVASVELHQKTLELRRVIFKGDHDHVLFSLVQLGIMLALHGDLAPAEARMQEALSMQERMGRKKDADLADALYGLGITLTKRGDSAAAKAALDRALAGLMEVFKDENSADVVDVLDALGVVEIARSDFAAAESWLVRAVAAARRSESLDYPGYVPPLWHLAWVLERRSDATNADTLRREALAISSKHGVYGGWPLLRGIYDLTDVLQTQGKFSEAEPLLKEAVAHAETPAGGSQVLRAAAYERSAQLYEAWDRAAPNTGKANQAADWRKQIEKLEPQVDPKPL